MSQIHSVAYQNDPSKPETFLGQITLNNPDVDYLQNSRFKNIPFDTNSLKSNGQSGHIVPDGDSIDNQEIFEQHRVTTYNPNKLSGKQRLNIKPASPRFPHLISPLDETADFQDEPSKPFSSDKIKVSKLTSSERSSSTEYKELLDIEPLLEVDISDIGSFRELMKNKNGSFDVEVIKSNKTEDTAADDSKPDASSMNTDNFLKEIPDEMARTTPTFSISTTMTTTPKNNDSELDEGEDEVEYVEYEYEDTSSPDIQHTTPPHNPTEHDIYDDYYSTEEIENYTNYPPSNATETFDILVMKPGNTTKTVKDDNFKQFTDTTAIDQTDIGNEEITPSITESSTEEQKQQEEENITSIETPSILGQEVVSVVTTKSVVNGTISIPDVTYAPSTAKIATEAENKNKTSSEPNDYSNDSSVPVTTENWVVVASVQTSRSVSGARFLPFPTVEQEEKKQVLKEDEEEDEEYVTKNPRLENSSSIASTENINDKLDSIQSELSSAVLSGSIDKENKNIELLTESTTESTTTSSTTTTTTALPNVFTLKSTLPPTFTERSAPDPLPVQIKKFTPRISSSTTPKPRRKPSLVTVMDDLSAALLPPGYKPRLSYKNKRTSTTTSTTTTTTKAPSTSANTPLINGTQGRSSGISSKNKVIVLDDKSLLPREYKPTEHKPQEDLIKKLQKDDLSKFLPPGYKTSTSEAPDTKNVSKASILDIVKQVDISAILPKGFNLPSFNTTTAKPKESKHPTNVVPVDITAFLPPGFKLNATENEKDSTDSILNKFKVIDDLSLLPPGFKLNQTEDDTPSSTTKAPGGIKLVFPSRPGGKVNRKTTTPKPMGPLPVTPKIQKGWPTR